MHQVKSAVERYKNIREVQLTDEFIKDETAWKKLCDEDKDHYALTEFADSIMLRLFFKVEKKLDSRIRAGKSMVNSEENKAMQKELEETKRALEDTRNAEMQNMKVELHRSSDLLPRSTTTASLARLQ